MEQEPEIDQDAAQVTSSETPEPVRPGDLLDLFSRPRQFFSGRIDLGGRFAIMAVVWLLGVTAQIDRIDSEILRHELDPARPTWSLIEPLVSEGWITFWMFCAIVGILSGTLIYFIAGWWYRIRLLWSGAEKDIDKAMPRYIYAWSTLVVALPHFLLAVAFTFTYPNYLAAYNSDEMFSLLIVLFMFWSVGISYIGATRTYELTPWKARTWFLILPIVWYATVMGLVVAVMAFFA